MKKRNQIVAMLLAVTMVTGAMMGCGTNENASANEGEVIGEIQESEEAEEEENGDSDVQIVTDASDNTLSASLKQKYAGSQSDKYEYREAIYNVASDHEFVFEGVGTRYQDEETFWDDICFYIEDDFDDPLLVDMEYDAEKETLTVLPGTSFQPLLYEDYNDTSSEDSSDERTWGNAPKYWMVQYNDFETGEKLSKPIVTMFTVEKAVAAPTIEFGIDKNGYAQLTWKAVEGAERYEIYQMDTSDDTGLSMVTPYKLAETTETMFKKFPSVEEEVDAVEGVVTQNLDFEDGGTELNGVTMDDAYCVVAVKGEERSNVSNIIYESKVKDRLVISLAYNYSESDAEEYDIAKDTILELPTYQLVEMANGAIVPMTIDYANATWDKYDEATDANNSNIVISTCIQGTNLKVEVYATDTPTSTIENDLATLVERQKKANKSADVKPQNDIDYVPSSDENQSQDSDEETATESKEEESESEEESETKEEESESEEATESKEDESESKEEETETAQTSEFSDQMEVTATSALSEYIATYLLCHEEGIDLSMFPEAGDSDYLVNALMEAYNQNPLIGSINRYGYDYETATLYIEYDYSKEEQEEMQKAVLAEADKVVSEIITDGMSDVEKEFAINNYLCTTAEYDYEALDNAEANEFMTVDHEFAHSFTPYGVLINKVGVCASYAGAFKILADKADLDCYVISGYLNGNLPHAWNRVALDGEWFTVDSTNNDNEMYENALLNIPDQMASGILVEDDTYLLSDELAKMTSSQEECEFYRVEDKYYGADELLSELETRLGEGETFTIRTDYTMTEEEIGAIIKEALVNAGVAEVRAYMFLGVLKIEM